MRKLTKRDKRMLNNIVMSFVVKGGAVIVGVLTIPAYMNYFSNDTVLGVWYTLLAILTWVLNFDLGIGNGMRNMLVNAFVHKDYQEAKKLISSSYISIGVLAILFILVGMVLVKVLDWNEVLNVPEKLIRPDILADAVLVVVLGVVAQFFLKLIVSILNAMEKTAISSLLPLISNIIVLIYIVAGVNIPESYKVLSLSWIYILAINIPYIIATIAVFSKSLNNVIPDIKYFSVSVAKKVLIFGGGFFGIQLALMVITVTNEIVINTIFGADKVVQYQVYNKVFYTIVTLFSLITNPIWSAISTAYCENRFDWIKITYKKLLLCVGIVSVGTIAIIFIMQPVVNIWLGANAIRVENQISIAFAIYSIVLMITYAESSVANGINKLKPQMYCYIVAAVLKIPICILMKYLGMEWYSVILTNGICLIPYIIVQHYIICKEIKNKI